MERNSCNGGFITEETGYEFKTLQEAESKLALIEKLNS